MAYYLDGQLNWGSGWARVDFTCWTEAPLKVTDAPTQLTEKRNRRRERLLTHIYFFQTLVMWNLELTYLIATMMIDDDDDNDYSSVSWRSTYKCCYYIIMIKAN